MWLCLCLSLSPDGQGNAVQREEVILTHFPLVFPNKQAAYTYHYDDKEVNNIVSIYQ